MKTYCEDEMIIQNQYNQWDSWSSQNQNNQWDCWVSKINITTNEIPGINWTGLWAEMLNANSSSAWHHICWQPGGIWSITGNTNTHWIWTSEFSQISDFRLTVAEEKEKRKNCILWIGFVKQTFELIKLFLNGQFFIVIFKHSSN